MKAKIILSLFAVLLLWSCQNDEFDTFLGNSSNNLIVNVNIPEPVMAKTRAGITDELQDGLFYVLVFDKNGLYRSKHQGILRSAGSYANYSFAGLPATNGEKLILHFIANYDWSGFYDADYIGKSEAEVLTGLTVQNGTVAYWKRYELLNGLDSSQGTELVLPETISLLRNIAKITVENESNDAVQQNYLTDVHFAIGNYMDCGTLAPYSASLSAFEIGAITEAIGGDVVPIAGDDDFVVAGDAVSGASSAARYVFERKNSTARKQTYIIIKGCFQKTPGGGNLRPSYYKIDIDNEAGTALLDLERNYHYIIKIKSVAMEGFSTLQAAMDGPASNNINAAVEVAEYTSVSDGFNILRIEKAVFSFVKSGQAFRIWYSYEANGIPANDKISVTLDDPALRVIEPGSFSYSNGVIMAKTADIPTNNDIYQATFTLFDGKHLTRKITIRLRKPLFFQNLSMTPNNGSDVTTGIVAAQVSQPATISFSFPPDMSPSVFPLPIYIYSKKLSPDPTKEGIQPLSTDPLVSGTFRYVYMAPYKGLDAQGVPVPHTVYFVTSTPSSGETITIASEFFNDATVQLQSVSIPALSGFSFSPNLTKRIVGDAVELKFTIPQPSDNTLPYRIRIHTDYLEYVSTSTGINCVWNDALGLYEYTTNQVGEQSIRFKTTRALSDETVRIDGDRFASISKRRTTIPGYFKDVTLDVSGQAAGSPATLNFSFDSNGAEYADFGGVYAYFTTQFLIPAPASGIESTGKANEYRMLVTSGTAQTANFVLKQNMPSGEAEKVKLSSPLFTDYLVPNSIPGKFTFGSSLAGYLNRPVLTIIDTNTPVSLSELGYSSGYSLRFSVPANAVSADKPLWVYCEFTNSQYLNSLPSNSGIAEMSPVAGINATRLWLKLTTPGDKTVDFYTNRANDSSVITLMSVSNIGSTVSDGRFETATGIQTK